MTLEYGSLLLNRYRITEILGQGGMGSVYRAHDQNLGIDVAVKENLFLSDEYARQFKREANILASLRHPSLPRVVDHFVITGQGQYLIMDYIEGEDLRQRMERTTTIPADEVIHIGVAVADALSYLHTRQPAIVHRDIKPGNIKITPDGQVVLVDFGLAKVMSNGQATTTGARAMTPGYSPPEQYGTARTDARTDVYSLGATLYACLTGVIPEDGLARATGSAQLTELRRLDSKINRKLANVIEKALALRAEDRYQTADDFCEALWEASGNGKRPKEAAAASPTGAVLVVSRPPSKPTGSLVPSAASYPAQDAESGIFPASGFSETGAAARPPSQPLVVTSPVYPASKERKTRRRGWAWVVMGALVVSAAAMLAAAALRPDLLPSVLPASFLPTATLTAAPPQPTATSGISQAALVGSPTNAIPPTATLELTSTPTTAPSPSPALSASLTPASMGLPTPTGSGVGKIAFVSERTGKPQIWLMNADGTQQSQLTDLQDGACQPDWSPDGARLVFTSPCSGKQSQYPGASLFLINNNGTGLTPLPVTPEGDFDPAWSPDGKMIAFTSLRDGKPQIYIFNLKDNTAYRISDMQFNERQPAWTPDGSKIAFLRERLLFQIWVMHPDGTDAQQFTRTPALMNNNPVWTDDGNFLLFNQYNSQTNLPWLMGMRTEDSYTNKEFRIPAKIQSDVGYISLGDVSPDSFWIAFEGWTGPETHDIWIMTLTGANRQRLTDNPAPDYSPAWAPDQP